MGCSQGALSRLYVEPGSSPYTFDASSETYEFLSESLQKRGVVVHPNGIRGTRSQSQERARLGPYTVGGSILFNPDPAMLDLWLPRILGGTESADSFPVAEGLPSFAVLMDRVAETFEYKDCYVGRATFAGKANQFGGEPQPLMMNVDITGKSRATATAVPAVSLSTASNTAPYIFEDGVFTIGGTARQVIDFMLVIDNHLQVRFTNSLTATDICPQSRSVYVKFTVPYNSGTPITSLLDHTIAGAAVLLTFTNGNMSLSFTLTLVTFPTIDPIVRGKTEIVLELGAFARMSGSTKEIVTTSDSTA